MQALHLSAAAVALACLCSPQVLAQTPEALYTESLAATCASCHGTQGRALAGSALPGLAGQPAAALIAKMLAYKAGDQTSAQTGLQGPTIMHQISKGYSSTQIEQLAAYFAAQAAK